MYTVHVYMYVFIRKKGKKINLIIRCLSSFYEIKMLHVHCVFICVYQRKMKATISLLFNS